jgi:uncharacterized membrane protein
MHGAPTVEQDACRQGDDGPGLHDGAKFWSRPIVLNPGVIETALVALALFAAGLVRPWRLLAVGAQHELIAPMIGCTLVLAALWWWPGLVVSPLLPLVGAQFTLLALGWPLAVLVFTSVGLFGLLAGASPAGAVAAIAWQGVLPATMALALGAVLRHLWRPNLPTYLLGRGFLVPMLCTWSIALLANAVADRHAWLGVHAGAALTLVALLDAMLTGFLVTMLVMHRPAALATWSDALYLGTGHKRAPA